MTHYFISYARKDAKHLARRLHAALKAKAGVTVWMDEALVTGKNWAAQIEAEIKRSDYVIVLLTPDVNRPASGTQGHSFVLNEIDYARTHHKTIIPVLVEPITLPIQLASTQYIDVTNLVSAKDRVRVVLKALPQTIQPSQNQSQKPQSQPTPGKLFQSQCLAGGLAIIFVAIIGVIFLLDTTDNENDTDTPSPVTTTSSPTPADTPQATTTATPVSTIQAASPVPTYALNFVVKADYWLLRTDTAAKTDLSSLRIRWHALTEPVTLHTLNWRERYQIDLSVNFTQLPPGTCLLLTTGASVVSEIPGCTSVYSSEYFSSSADLYVKTQSYSVSLDGGQTYPDAMKCSNSHNPCQINMPQ